MEGHCSTGQSPQWAVVPMEGEEEEEHRKTYIRGKIYEIKKYLVGNKPELGKYFLLHGVETCLRS